MRDHLSSVPKCGLSKEVLLYTQLNTECHHIIVGIFEGVNFMASGKGTMKAM